MSTLYHLPGGVCPQKAIAAMFEKGAQIDLCAMTREALSQPSYLALNPRGVTPTLVTDNGDVIVESSIVMRFIDEAFEGPPLQPPAPADRAVMGLWMKRMDDELFPAVGCMTVATLLRDDLLKLPEDELLARLTRTAGPAVARLRADAVAGGPMSAAIRSAILTVETHLAEMERVLARRTWLAGSQLSLAELALAPFFLRLEELGLERWWRDRPALADWWSRTRGRESLRTMRRTMPSPLAARLHETAAGLRAEAARQLAWT